MEHEDKIDMIVGVIARLADIMKDPTDGGKTSASADDRTRMREEAHDELIVCVDVLAAGAQFNSGIFDVISIANKYGIKEAAKQSNN